MKRWTATVLFTLLCAGCVTTGVPFNREHVAQIKEGVTTKDEIIAMFGRPDTVDFTEQRRPVLKYRYFKYRSKVNGFLPVVGWFSSGIKTEEEILHIILDRQDVVESFVFDEAISDIDTGLIKSSKDK